VSIEGISGVASVFAWWNGPYRDQKPVQPVVPDAAAGLTAAAAAAGGVVNAAIVPSDTGAAGSGVSITGVPTGVSTGLPTGLSTGLSTGGGLVMPESGKPGQRLLAEDVQLLFAGYVPPKTTEPAKSPLPEHHAKAHPHEGAKAAGGPHDGQIPMTHTGANGAPGSGVTTLGGAAHAANTPANSSTPPASTAAQADSSASGDTATQSTDPWAGQATQDTVSSTPLPPASTNQGS